MGILNVTPDSFSDGGKYFKLEDAINHAQELIKKGVDIIDIGGESTRPNATPVPEEEELKRVIPIIKKLFELTHLGTLAPRHFRISIDTYKAGVAKAALEAGASIINDVSGLTMDPNMVKVASEANCKVVIMHNHGIPATKSVNNEQWIVNRKEIYLWLKAQTDFAMKNGIRKENIIIDPGIGFGKTAEEDLYLIESLKEFKSLGFPVLVGPSKKSFIKKLFPNEDLEQKSQELTDLAIKNGVDIIRIH